MSDLADDKIPVVVSCRVLGLARQPYYRWRACPITASEWDQAVLTDAVFQAHREDPEFGYRFIVDEVRAAGFEVAERTVWRICSDNGWWSSFCKRRGKNGKKPGPPVHDDLLAVVDEHGVMRASSTCARSRTSGRTGSWATPSTIG